MSAFERPDAIAAARQFVAERFPTSSVAFLGGSVAAGAAGEHSDLDIVVIADEITTHWASHEALGWMIEIFALTPPSLPQVFALDARRRWPLHLALCKDGQMLRDRDGLAEQIQTQAREIYAAGPPPLTAEEIAEARYNLTWMLDDLADVQDISEMRLMSYDLATYAGETWLKQHRQWLGKGKWLLRQLQHADATVAQQFAAGLAALDEAHERGPLMRFAGEILQALGGHGFGGQYFAYRLDVS